MDYLIEMLPDSSTLPAIEAALRDVDPAAVADFDARHGVLRVAAALTATELQAALGSAGFAVAPERIQRKASTCCGGCGG